MLLIIIAGAIIYCSLFLEYLY